MSENIASRIQLLRKQRNISQQALADALHVSKSTIGLWENETTIPNAKFICEMAEYFDVSADYLLGLSNAKSYSTDLHSVCDYVGLSEETVFMFVVAKNSGISNVFEKAIKQTTDLICEIRGSTNDRPD